MYIHNVETELQRKAHCKQTYLKSKLNFKQLFVIESVVLQSMTRSNYCNIYF